MRKNLCLLFMGMILFPFTAQASSYAKTGKNLPGLLKEAIKVLPKADLDTGEKLDRQISNNDVIFITDINAFCEDRKISTMDCDQLGMAFVINRSFPIYINGRDVEGNFTYNKIATAYSRGYTGYAYIFAAMIWHERYHAMGDGSEVAAYTQEIKLLEHFQQQGKLGPEYQFYAEATRAELANAKDNDAALTVTALRTP